MIVNLLGALLLGFNESKSFRIGVYCTLIIILLMFCKNQYDIAVENAYKRGEDAAYAELAKQQQSQSVKLQSDLQAIFENHMQTIQQSLQKDKERHDEIAKILQNNVYQNNCHSDDGVKLLNEQIKQRVY